MVRVRHAGQVCYDCGRTLLCDPTVLSTPDLAAAGFGGPRQSAPRPSRPTSSADDPGSGTGQEPAPLAVAPTSKSLLGRVVVWLQRPLAEKLWLFPAFVLLGLSRFLLLVVPFSTIAPLLGRDMKAMVIGSVATAREVSRALAIGRAIATAARHTPWESQCLAQAVTARVLLGLNRLPYVLHLGVRVGADSTLAAHAWVSTGRGSVTGGHGSSDFKVLGTFVSPNLVPPERC